ncbi:MAG TPA: DUF87 domain-containing protein [Acidimicrobiales bacterium]|jgi:hypothetical protein|nr:DUF87 domain-containing protein [Acidimicrobiales bacterium]
MSARTFGIGETVDGDHKRTGEAVTVASADFTTHGVIVGMTGSGKTGLGIVLMEEALLAGIPLIAFDPKGDLGNLLLTFPKLDAPSFEPWVDPSAAQQAGQDVPTFAATQADAWTKGLADWGLGPDRIQALRDAAEFTIFTPGSTSGVPLNIVGSLAAPKGVDPESLNDEIEGFVSGLLGLIGIQADPLSSREHILLSNLLANAWGNGQDLDLATLVAQVAQPPIRKLGVFELDQFFPPKDRTQLAMQLNGLLASPSFSAWGQGVPLDIDHVLQGEGGKPRAAIVSTAHLSDDERQFVTSMILGKLITWMRRQSGTSDLRALVYMDEVAGYAPPNGAPPAKKPILTLLKQARAFGVGLVLATQNPVDVDYKALSNAGTWMVGRLQTEQDRSRLLDGMSSAAGGVDVKAVGDTIAGLGKREFVLRSPGANQPKVFTTRWALSYLRGPITRDQIASLMANAPEKAASASPAASDAPAAAAAETAQPGVSADASDPATGAAAPASPVPPPAPAAPATIGAEDSPVAPQCADGVAVHWIDSAAAWAPTVGATAGTRYEAAAVARVNLVFDDTKTKVRTTQEWEAVLHPLGPAPNPADATVVDYDDRDLLDQAPAGAVYRLPDAPIDKKTFWSKLQKDLVAQLVATQQAHVLQCASLKVVAAPGEAEEAFRARVAQAASDAADKEAAALRTKYEAKLTTEHKQLVAAQEAAGVAEASAKSQRTSAVLSAAGSLLGSFLGGRRNTGTIVRSIGRAASRSTSTGAAGRRVEAAETKVESEQADIERLEAELSSELAAIDAKWKAAADDITPLDIALERADVTVTELVLGWLPVG